MQEHVDLNIEAKNVQISYTMLKIIMKTEELQASTFQLLLYPD